MLTNSINLTVRRLDKVRRTNDRFNKKKLNSAAKFWNANIKIDTQVYKDTFIQSRSQRDFYLECKSRWVRDWLSSLYFKRMHKDKKILTDTSADPNSLAFSHAISTPSALMDLMKGLGDLGGLTGAHSTSCEGSAEQPHTTLLAFPS